MNYVCTVCSKTLLENLVPRDSDNNHSGTAPFVRFIDYKIGRIEGRCQPSDPLLYRRRKNNISQINNNSYSFKSSKNVNAANKASASHFTAISDKTIKEPHYGVTITKSNSGNNNKEDREWQYSKP
jgi:hypothetical protein